MPKPKYKHIVLKDKADETSRKLRDAFETLQEVLKIKTEDNLLTNSDKELQLWYKDKISENLAFKKEVKQIVNDQTKNITKDLKSSLKDIGTSKKIIDKLAKDINAKADNLGNVFISQRNAMISNVNMLYHPDKKGVDTINTLFNQITSTISKNDRINKMYVPMKDRDGHVRKTKDGTTMHEKYESYIERTVRTEIHSSIAKDIVKAGASIGNIFYICSSFGDSRKEHADLQGKIYVDKDWETIISDESLKEQISEYIAQHNVMTIQEVQDEETYGLGTWCNCRHSFEMIDIEMVLGINNDKDLDKVRDDLQMNFNGEYEETKNKALNKQRYYERGIKEWKNKREEAELRVSKLGKDASPEDIKKANNYLAYTQAKVRMWQKHQRQHISKYDNLRRDYARENPNDFYDLGARRKK